MNPSPVSSHLLAPAQPLAHLGAQHGYRFEGDTVHLNAMFGVAAPEAHQRAWALQLWACPTTPDSRAAARGHLVAHAALPPIGEIADESYSFGLSVDAFPPAGREEYFMMLALVTADAGNENEVHDCAVYPQYERFSPLSFDGSVGYQMEGDRVWVRFEKVANARAADNVSGTLAIELWALPKPYAGSSFRNAVPLAGVAIDPLPGQWEYRPSSFDLPLALPAAGTWNLALMLREWTPSGFVTRDYRNFDHPYVLASDAPVPPVETPAPRPLAKAAAVKKPVRGNRGAAKATPAKASRVSVNQASVDELIAVKGLPAKVAQAIVEGRPFKSLDELVNVKGVGAKLLERLRTSLKL